MMRIGIDATNIRSGGGAVHLVEMLRAADPAAHGFDHVTVWGVRDVLDRVDDRPWLERRVYPHPPAAMGRRLVWQHRRLAGLARRARCSVLLVPGGTYTGSFTPFVAISQNLLPFVRREIFREGVSAWTLRLAMLRLLQARTMRRAAGVIFLTEWSRDHVGRLLRLPPEKCAVVPHGVPPGFARQPRAAREPAQCSEDDPFRVLLVSSVAGYKHQREAVEAVSMLRASGVPVALDLVGGGSPAAVRRLQRRIQALGATGHAIHYHGKATSAQLVDWHRAADLFLFPSSCESMSITLLEAMAAGLPIACADRGTLRETVGSHGAYFDPDSPQDCARVIAELFRSPARRADLAAGVSRRARSFAWARCASLTMSALARAARRDVGPT